MSPEIRRVRDDELRAYLRTAIDGYVRYHAQSKWELRQPRNLIEVDELHALTGGMDEHRAGAGADAERLLRTPDEPWCSTFF